ncbi:DUF2939 domain-containing protein [Halopseudomonas phragmitis]|uniref:DUF2939 domain-containing protein n=1 Tax=Halopseudomonas phragmitis TaxID=1931241 RepID=A0A1V0B9L3_9GAMM|nr:DUF2939 domain-containing protein [Halopseudomonas phragmitis]AQZ96629.1 hypothetical protein BVH74_18555 [Halopseudomonas phragmitis]
MNQCPACNYELTMAEQASSQGKCPNCDVYFAKVLARQQQAAPVSKRARVKTGKGKLAYLGVGLAVVFAGYIYASPYLAVNSLKAATEARNAPEMSEYIDFPSVRQNLKEQMTASIMVEAGRELGDNPFAAMGMALATTMIDGLLEGMVTPSGLAALMAGESPGGSASTSQDGSSRSVKEPFADASMGYRGLNRFVVVVPNEAGEVADFVFRRSGLVGWKLTELHVPVK